MLTARGSQYCYESKYIKTFVFILDTQLKVYLPCNDYSLWVACFDYVCREQKSIFFSRLSFFQAQTHSQGIKHQGKTPGSLSQAWSQHSTQAYGTYSSTKWSVTHIWVFSDLCGVELSMFLSNEASRRTASPTSLKSRSDSMLHQKMSNGIYVFLNQLWSWKRIRQVWPLLLPPQNLFLIGTGFDLGISVNCRENPETNLSNHRLKKIPKQHKNQPNTFPKTHVWVSQDLLLFLFSFKTVQKI